MIWFMFYRTKLNTRFKLIIPMKKVINSQLTGFMVGLFMLTISSLKAECTYEQMLRAEEFPIGIMLSWSTAFENNTSMFILEKADDNAEFQAVGTVRASGNSKTVKKYNFLDPQATAPKISYRIKQVDFDGTFSYTEVLTVKKKLESNVMLVQLSNETVNKSFDFTIDAMKEGGAVLQLVDGAGNIAWQGTKMLSNGLNTLTIDMSAQREGVYKVLVMMDKDEKSLTIRKTYDEVEKASNVAGNKKVNKN